MLTLTVLKSAKGSLYKTTRRMRESCIPETKVTAETKVFCSKESALKQLNEWLQ
jgi:hypothetical protein